MKGSCLCGDISWEIDAEPSSLTNCHCSMCRKVHGTPFGTYASVGAADFRWLTGEEQIRKYESSPGAYRGFCPQCGSVAPALMPDGSSVFMPAGNLEGDIAGPIGSHLFVGSKAPWYDITDSIDQFDAYPPQFAAEGQDRPAPEPETPGSVGGTCLCGTIAFEFDGPVDRMGYCHCSRCRKSRSAAHSAQTFVPVEQFRWLRGDTHVTHYKLPESQFFYTSFCDTCGSPMPTGHESIPFFMVPLGALDQEPGLRPQAHIHVGSKASWFDITDDLPQFEEMPDG